MFIQADNSTCVLLGGAALAPHHQYQRDPDPLLKAKPATHAMKKMTATIHSRWTANPKPKNNNANKSASSMTNKLATSFRVNV
jgi:hypothetical protein